MRTVLVVRLDGVGDVLLAGPAVRAVAAAADVDRVLLLCSPAGEPAARLLPGVSATLTWRCPWIDADPPPADPADVTEVVARIAAERVDTALVLTSFHQSPLPTALLLRMAGVRRIGAVSVDYPGTLLDVRLRPGVDLPEGLPEPRRALAVATALGFGPPAGDEGRLAVCGLPDVPVPPRYVVVHPGASVPARAWSPARNAEAVTGLAAAGHTVVVTGGPGERALTSAVAGRHGTDLGGRTTLAELAAVLAGADAVVVGNTGPAHLAAAVGTPVVSLFAPVVPAVKWAPYGVPHVLLGVPDAPCRDTRATMCPVPGHPCLNTVTAAAVVRAVTQLTGDRQTVDLGANRVFGRSVAGYRRAMSKPNPIQMQKFLGGINYPASRDELVEHARSAGADEAVLEHLRALPDQMFDGPNAVSQAYSNET